VDIEKLMSIAKIDMPSFDVTFPCIPPFSHFLETLTKLRHTQLFSSGKINWIKLRIIGTSLVLIRPYLIHKYNFINQSVVETFIKQRTQSGDFNVTATELDKLTTLAINTDQHGSLPASTDTNLLKIISKFNPS